MQPASSPRPCLVWLLLHGRIPTTRKRAGTGILPLRSKSAHVHGWLAEDQHRTEAARGGFLHLTVQRAARCIINPQGTDLHSMADICGQGYVYFARISLDAWIRCLTGTEVPNGWFSCNLFGSHPTVLADHRYKQKATPDLHEGADGKTQRGAGNDSAFPRATYLPLLSPPFGSPRLLFETFFFARAKKICGHPH